MCSAIKKYGKSELTTLVLAHGAGAGMDSDFMVAFAEGLSARGLQVVLFEFPYMQKRRIDGKRRPPDRAPKLMEYYKEVIADLEPGRRLIIGGKSMGGRIASMLLAENNKLADGLLMLGYPFAPPGKPDKLRVEHFPDIENPTVIVQGERDTFGGKAFVEDLTLPLNFNVFWSEDGDHSLKPRKASGRTESENWEAAMDAVIASHLFD